MGIFQNKASDHNHEIIKAFEDQVIKINGRYKVALTWKHDSARALDDNRETSTLRLESRKTEHKGEGY